MSWGLTSCITKVRYYPLYDFVNPLCFFVQYQGDGKNSVETSHKTFINLYYKMAIKYPRFCSFFYSSCYLFSTCNLFHYFEGREFV